MAKYRTITVEASSVLRAMKSVEDKFDDWQAQYLEVLLLPNVYKRWKQANPNMPDMVLNRVSGETHKGFTPEDNRAVGDAKGWSLFAGYTLRYCLNPSTGESSGWNGVRDDYYCHSPSVAWDGVRRDTYHQFVQDIAMTVTLWSREKDVHHSSFDLLEKYGVKLVNDLSNGDNNVEA